MSRLGSENLQKHKGSYFNFTAVRMDDLGAQDYTLVTVVVDKSGSVASFYQDMEKALKEVLGACLESPRCDNLMLRLVTFNNNHQEVHGFKLLADINPSDYDGILQAGGATALYDACVDSIDATNKLGNQLLKDDYGVNGIVVVITDGCDNSSTLGPKQVKESLQDAVQGENLESLVSILVAVNVAEDSVKQVLEQFNNDVGFTQFVPLENADKKTLAKLAQFISKSISSQSQALGSGGPSQSITF